MKHILLIHISPQTEELDSSKRLPLTAESLDTRGLYIFDDGFQFVIWFGRSVSLDIARNLLGEDFAADKVCFIYHLNIFSYIKFEASNNHVLMNSYEVEETGVICLGI